MPIFVPEIANTCMAEDKKKRGRPSTGVKTVDIHYKMSRVLYDALPLEIKRNTYINDAVRDKMIRDGYLSEKLDLDKDEKD